MLEFQARLNAKYMPPALHCISSFEGTSYKKLHDTTSPFASCCFTLAFIYISRYEKAQLFFPMVSEKTSSHFILVKLIKRSKQQRRYS